MHLTIAAASAVVAALLEFTVVPYVRLGGAAPHPVLVFGVVWAIAGGIEAGLAWAFVGGLALDILGQRPLGSTAFALLISIGAAGMIGNLLSRARPVAPVIATACCSVLYSMLLLATVVLLRGPLAVENPTAGVIPDAVYDTVLAAIAGPLAVALVLRRRDAQRVDW